MDTTVSCPWAKSDMTPCVLCDGEVAYADHGHCAGCDANPIEISRERQRQRDEAKGGEHDSCKIRADRFPALLEPLKTAEKSG
jgi:hypothetical protein